MKKIIAVFLMFVMIATSVTAITTTQKKENNEVDEYTNEDCYGYNVEKLENSECECEYIDGYAVMSELPPKSQELLDLMIDNPTPTVSADQLPDQFSWKNLGGDWTTSAKDQENCGSCWAFGALGAMESAINIASGDPDTDIDLSEQYVLSCLPAAGSCDGGWMSEAIMYIESTDSGSTGNDINGCPIESCMPYQAVDYIPCSDKCPDWDYHTNPIQDDNKLFEVLDYGVTQINPNLQSDWDLLKSWVYTYGPISVDIYASNGWSSFWSSHHSPNDVYEGTETGTWTNHAQLLCGWVDDPNVYNGGYWILKNSWGTDWGYQGFNNLAYGCLMLGDRDVTWVSTPDWPQSTPPDPQDPEYVYAGFDYDPGYPKIGEEIEFMDTSTGNVALYEWDLDGDGEFDVSGMNERTPEWTYNSEGEYDITLLVWSTTGLNSEMTKTIQVKEEWVPIAVSDPDYYGGDETEVLFDAYDSWDPDGTIVSYEWDFDGDGSADSAERSDSYVFPNQDGEYTVTLTVTDNDGLKGSCEIDVKIDITKAPVTTAYVGGVDQNEDVWFNGNVRVDLKATDWTGVYKINYRLDDGEWHTVYCDGEKEYTYDEITVVGHGIHEIEYYAEDIYGNVEDTKTSEIKIDTVDPTAEITLEGEKYEEWFISPVTVTLTGSDDDSGLSVIRYKYGISWEEYTGPFLIPNNIGGGIVIQFQAEDSAGNIYNNLETVFIDMPPKAPKIDGPRSGLPGESYEFSFVTTDVHQGEKISYFIEWGDGTDTGWTEYVESGESIKKSHTWDTKQVYVITAKAKDEMGAESEKSTITISLPKEKAFSFDFFDNFLGNFPIVKYVLKQIFY